MAQVLDEVSAAMTLQKIGQEDLLQGLDAKQRESLFAQINQLDKAYSGGLEAYVNNARRLLAASQKGENPLEGFTPSVPEGERLEYASESFLKFENLGREQAKSGVFVLVAGGLGERLGFPGIKVKIQISLAAGWTYLEFYCRGIKALAGDTPIPLVIMTSDDTHSATLALLEENSYFGLDPSNVHLLKQEKVACLADNDARLSKDAKDPGRIETKPHGHGDIHALLHTSGLAKRFQSEGKKWVVFFQDTNVHVFRGVLAALGVSAEKGFAFNSVCVPRTPKEAIGGIAKLTRADGTSLTMNVEYNQLDPLLRATGYPDGDSADSTGFSPFPGSINQLVLNMDSYVSTLERTSGIIAEFVNPKYKDSTKTAFKSSTRLECMMQDFPKELPPEAPVGFTMFDSWVSFSPVKNSPDAAVQKFKEGNHPACGTTGEADLFTANCRVLRKAGVDIEPAKKCTFNGIEVDFEASVVFSPQWALTFQDVRSRLVAGGSVKISQRSTLVLDGDITIENLTLDGALTITAAKGCTVRIAKLVVSNKGCILEQVAEDEQDPQLKIKGFKLRWEEVRKLHFDTPGDHVISE